MPATDTQPATRVSSLARVIAEIQRLMETRFTGSVTLHFGEGRLDSAQMDQRVGQRNGWRFQ